MIVETNRKILIAHAKKTLESKKSGKEMAEEINMNTRQFYNYRNGSMDISKARLETLLKFEILYKKYFIENE